MDVHNNPDKRDDDFTPEGKYRWTTQRYQKKLKDLAEVLSSYRGNYATPDFIGLCEVENYQVVEDLISQPTLHRENYQIIHAESDDQRGIDLCFLYKKKSFTYQSHKLVSIDRHSRNQLFSRDIMMVKGKLPNGSELHIFINHWPSRHDGEKLTRYKRAAAARTIREEIRGIYALEEKPKIIICGDFNDDPPSFSLNNILKAGKKANNYGQLINLAWEKYEKKQGTVYHDNRWYMFDQFIVSFAMYQRIVDHGFHLVKNEHTIYLSRKDQSPKPNRTFYGDRYTGGVSDHLPVWIAFE